MRTAINLRFHVGKNAAYLLFLLVGLFFCSEGISQEKYTLSRHNNKDSVAHHNLGILLSCSILEGNGYRFEHPAYFYSGKRHGFSIAAASKFEIDKPAVFGATFGYFFFLEPAFRDISFYFNYNASTFFETNPVLTHIFGGGVQIDLFKRFFLHHSVGLGFQQTTADFRFLNTSGQLKLSLGFYIREIPVVHIHDDWEH
jgi:hypothetical protein